MVRDASGPEPETEALAGPAVETIVSAARAGGYDLIVVGTRGRGRREAALLGSVSAAVAAHAGRPVLVVGDSASALACRLTGDTARDSHAFVVGREKSLKTNGDMKDPVVALAVALALTLLAAPRCETR